jgi:hypothetical protein
MPQIMGSNFLDLGFSDRCGEPTRGRLGPGKVASALVWETGVGSYLGGFPAGFFGRNHTGMKVVATSIAATANTTA